MSRKPKGQSPPFDRYAFSLIELIVVMLILAMLAGMAAYSMRGAVARQRLASGVERVQQFDLALRRSARAQRKLAMGRIDRSGGQLLLKSPDGKTRRFRLPGRVEIESFRIAGRGSDSTITARRDGSTATYAIQLAAGDARIWVLFAGGTGQVSRISDRLTVATLLGMP